MLRYFILSCGKCVMSVFNLRKVKHCFVCPRLNPPFTWLSMSPARRHMTQPDPQTRSGYDEDPRPLAPNTRPAPMSASAMTRRAEKTALPR